MIIDFGSKTIQSKIVFYGPAMSGKTTALKYLFNKFNGELISITTSHLEKPRTLFYDYGCIDLKFGVWKLKLNLWTATGQDFYCATRSTVLQGVDGIIFVADSRREILDENKRSWSELVEYFGDKLVNIIPIIVCLNKQDLENLTPEDLFKEYLDLKENVEIIKMIAIRGEKVYDAFTRIFKNIFSVHSNIKDTISHQLK